MSMRFSVAYGGVNELCVRRRTRFRGWQREVTVVPRSGVAGGVAGVDGAARKKAEGMFGSRSPRLQIRARLLLQGSAVDVTGLAEALAGEPEDGGAVEKAVNGRDGL